MAPRYSGGVPWGYHLGNLLAHAAVSVLVLALALRLRPDLPRGAVAGALLFAAHPIHTEAVWYEILTEV